MSLSFLGGKGFDPRSGFDAGGAVMRELPLDTRPDCPKIDGDAYRLRKYWNYIDIII
jgi:hypothetical protein